MRSSSPEGSFEETQRPNHEGQETLDGIHGVPRPLGKSFLTRLSLARTERKKERENDAWAISVPSTLVTAPRELNSSKPIEPTLFLSLIRDTRSSDS